MSLCFLQTTVSTEAADLPALFRDWRQDTIQFLRHDVPKILLVVIGAYVLVRVLRGVARQGAELQIRKLPPGVRVQQVRTVASVLTSIGVFVISFVALLMVLGQLGLNLGPMLASAGIAGLAIGFGAQSLVHDFINGFFILLENQYDIGDTVRIAGVKGVVERMSLRNTVLRDEDGTLHTVPNSAIQIVSNTTRDWSQLALRVTVAYSEPSDKIVGLLKQIGADLRNDSKFEQDIVSDIDVPGIDRVGNGEAEYLVLIKTRPNKQYAITREMRRRIKECFEKNNVQPAGPGRIYVMDQGAPKAS
jgi:moderate conductance mechanosensitive channel